MIGNRKTLRYAHLHTEWRPNVQLVCSIHCKHAPWTLPKPCRLQEMAEIESRYAEKLENTWFFLFCSHSNEDSAVSVHQSTATSMLEACNFEILGPDEDVSRQTPQPRILWPQHISSHFFAWSRGWVVYILHISGVPRHHVCVSWWVHVEIYLASSQ
jgi:hypothetical protein